MPLAATLGLGCIPCECVTALVLNLHGNALTLSRDLWQRGVRDGATLRNEIRREGNRKTFTFGSVYGYSSHSFLLRQWLTRSGIQPGRDARIVIVPPPQMVANLQSGHLDGFCVGEPWSSVAIQSGTGWCAATSAELEPGHPEKVLMVRADFAEKRADEHLAIVGALLEACEFCDNPANREQLISTLARPEYVGAPESTLRRGIYGEFDFGNGIRRPVADFNIFHRDNANEPSTDKAAWVFNHFRQQPSPPETAMPDFAVVRRVFRADLFERAVRLRGFIGKIHEKEKRNEPQFAPA
jgi:ABC-type nitrate/sulfonate/bicarbonate transport system substrate-binding protein